MKGFPVFQGEIECYYDRMITVALDYDSELNKTSKAKADDKSMPIDVFAEIQKRTEKIRNMTEEEKAREVEANGSAQMVPEIPTQKRKEAS